MTVLFSLLLLGAPKAGLASFSPAAIHSLTDSQGLEPKVLDAALTAWSRAQDRVRKPVLTVIDYDLPSTERRLWVIDVEKQKVLFHELVAHGRGSGDDRPVRFGNEGGSHVSSLGVFLTGETYQGKHGYSLSLDGLEKGFNDRARERDIVIHGADYVSDSFAKRVGRLGRSWGCPAVAPAVSGQLIDTIKGGSLVFVYASDPTWLRSSAFLR